MIRSFRILELYSYIESYSKSQATVTTKVEYSNDMHKKFPIKHETEEVFLNWSHDLHSLSRTLALTTITYNSRQSL